MFRLNLIIFCICLLLPILGLEAQTLLWQEDFGTGIPNTWTSADINGNGVNWTYCENHEATPTATCPGIFDGTANNQDGFTSTSIDNGFAVFDSDAHGLIIHNAYLQAPDFDFTDQSEVWITFEYQIGVFQNPTPSNMVLEIKEAGNFWEPIDITNIQIGNSPKPEFIRWSRNPELAIIDISAYAAGKEIQLRWRWVGSFEFYWALDDIKIYDGDPRALFLSEVDFEMACFNSFAPNFKTPQSQVESFPLLTDVFNRGYLPANDAQLKTNIFAGISNAYSKSVSLPLLESQSLTQNIFVDSFPPLLDEIAIYNGSYSIGPLENDPTPENNDESFQFWVTENTFAKEPGPSVYTRPSDANWGTAEHDWAWGNIYHVPHGNGYEVASISFSIGPSNGQYFYDIAQTTVSIILYEWDDQNQDGRVQLEERTIVGLKIYTIEGNETDLSYLTVNFNSEEVPLKDDTDYIAMVDFQAQSSAADIEIGSYILMDYGSTVYASQQLGSARFPTAIWIRDGSSDVFETQGLGFNVIPSITMDIRPLGTPVNDRAEYKMDFKVYPNPSSKQVTVQFDENQDFSENSNLLIFNTLGQIVHSIPWKTTDGNFKNVALDGLNNGIYQLRLSTESHKDIFVGKVLVLR